MRKDNEKENRALNYTPGNQLELNSDKFKNMNVSSADGKRH
jgi:hypothetical protein